MSTATQFVCLSRFTGSNIPTNYWSWVIKRTIIFKNVNNHPYKDWESTANQSGVAIKVITHKHIRWKCGISKIYKDIRQSRLCSAHLMASSASRIEGVPTNTHRGRGSGLCLLWRGVEKFRVRLNINSGMMSNSLENKVYSWYFTISLRFLSWKWHFDHWTLTAGCSVCKNTFLCVQDNKHEYLNRVYWV